MLTIRPRGKKGIYWMFGTVNGERIRESTGTSSKEHAEVRRLTREKELLDRKYLGPEKTATFAEAAVIYLEAGGDARFISPVLDWFGLYRIKDITQSEILRFAGATYPAVSGATLNRQVFTPISAVLRTGAKAGLCQLPTLIRPKQKRRVVEFATDEWLAKFLDAAKGNASLAAIVLFMTTTGTRVTEACRLQWDDIDPSKENALLRQTKNGEPRRVVLVPVMREALAALDERAVRVFGYASRFSVNQAIERVCNRAGIRYLSSHKLGRHAFAARLLNAGHSLKVVAEAGGWRSLWLAGQTYGHLERSTVDHAVISASNILQPDADNIVKLPLRTDQFHIPKGKCGVYIIGAGGYHKVGIADDARARLSTLQVGCPLPLEIRHVEIVATRRVATVLERLMHEHLQDYKITGEWFACSLDTVMGGLAAAGLTSASDTIQVG